MSIKGKPKKCTLLGNATALAMSTLQYKLQCLCAQVLTDRARAATPSVPLSDERF